MNEKHAAPSLAPDELSWLRDIAGGVAKSIPFVYGMRLTILAYIEDDGGDGFRVTANGLQRLREKDEAERRQKDAEKWRNNALTARRMADEAIDPRSRKQLLDVACSYERLERLAEEAVAGRDLPDTK